MGPGGSLWEPWDPRTALRPPQREPAAASAPRQEEGGDQDPEAQEEDPCTPVWGWVSKDVSE